MNPSTGGWIKKFEAISDHFFIKVTSFEALYNILRSNGFLYGFSSKTLINLDLEQRLSQDEIEKFNLLSAFYFIYKLNTTKTFIFKHFIASVIAYFKSIEAFELSLWDKFIAGKDLYQQLERIIHEHIQIDHNILTKQFNKKTTSSLLFIDVLGYQYFLAKAENSFDYIKKLEYIIVNIINDINNFKEKSKSERKSAVRLISESINYNKTETIDVNYRYSIGNNFKQFEKKYFLDIAVLSIWEPVFNDDKSYNFIQSLGADMNFTNNEIKEATDSMVQFYDSSKNSTLFKASNYLNNFYDNTSQLVIKLIKRNSSRILKEISQSKELMVLLSQSTLRELTKEEQEKLQFQLLDILKTIPSLAIFLLPGGAILLPIFAKLIPNMLPSAFNDNKVD